MDLSGFVRRFQSSTDDDHQEQLQTKPQGLTVDTSTMKDFKSKLNSLEHAKQEPQFDSPPGSGRSSTAATPTSARGHSDVPSDYQLRRRRSNSECLMFAKNRPGAEIPGPCKEYINGVKQILARSEESQPALLRRRSSMSLKSGTMLGK
ncbi:hypothetical protein FI667_g706, partial [Globisporangium splendens]